MQVTPITLARRLLNGDVGNAAAIGGLDIGRLVDAAIQPHLTTQAVQFQIVHHQTAVRLIGNPDALSPQCLD